MTRTHILLEYRYIPNIANTEDYPWREYKVGRGLEAKIPPLEVLLLMGSELNWFNYEILQRTDNFCLTSLHQLFELNSHLV